MCGIAGYVGTDTRALPEGVFASMHEAIRWRGLDDSGQWRDGKNVVLLHSRLSIIDLASGDQPMQDISGRLAIILNGEIYNYVELRAEYEKQGARFRTQSDTEVILEGYKLKGPAVVRDLLGMFAFAIWNKDLKEMFLARDPVGKKPLYWFQFNESFFFSSTLDAFSTIPGWSGKLSRINLDFYSSVGSFPPGLTAFMQGRSLPPGCHATVRAGKAPVIERYWRLDFGTKSNASLNGAIEEYEAILTDAVRIRLRADVPVALTFSGGVDSGTIAAIATRRLGTRLKCFTIDYHTDDDPSDETIIARRMAGHLGLDWQFIPFDYRTELIPALETALEVVDQPCNHIAISYSQRLYEAVRPHAKVVLSGNGADELFLGYDGNEELRARDLANQIGMLGRLRRKLKRMMRSNMRTRELAAYQCEYVRANLGTYTGEPAPDEIVASLRSEIEAAGMTSHVDLYTFMSLAFYTCDANFRLPDIAGLRAQVEVRSPFLDHRMIEFAARLPAEFKIGSPTDARQNKFLPKEYYRRHAPEDVALARKKGMGWNLRYDDGFVMDPGLTSAYEDSLQAIAAVGLNEERYRAAWNDFISSKKAGIRYPASAGVMIAGFMLGRWIVRRQSMARVAA
jgi:asparagine synthase (glutamine-hydrolysing)